MIFSLDENQQVALSIWMESRPPKYEGASGGRYVYSFCPTSLGLVVKIRDEITKEEIDLTDYESW